MAGTRWMMPCAVSETKTKGTVFRTRKPVFPCGLTWMMPCIFLLAPMASLYGMAIIVTIPSIIEPASPKNTNSTY